MDPGVGAARAAKTVSLGIRRGDRVVLVDPDGVRSGSQTQVVFGAQLERSQMG